VQSGTLNFGEIGIEYGFAEPAAGTGADLVMLHEGLGSLAMWRDFPERLAQATGCRVLAYSRLSYGRSSALQQERGVDYMHVEADTWLPALLERLEIHRPILFGHSDGASIALIHAARSHHDLAGIIALAPHVMVEDLTVSSIERARTAYTDTDLRARLSRYHADVDAAFWGWNRIWLDPAFRAWNIENLLPDIRCPVLAIQGEQDEYGTMRQIDIIGQALPGTTLLALPDCRHSPHRDRPDAVLDSTRRFIEDRCG
jgi:pimeloyl-ACP methyl ester carboxylesterase